jgi:quercetin dioxygenase-like cupin family protein
MEKRAGPPLHEHAWDEAYYVVEGQVRFTLGDRALDVQAGDFLYAPGGVPHGFQGASDRPARMLIFDAPAHAEDFFRDMDREVKAFPEEAYKIPEIGQRHAIRFFTPPPPGA